MKIIIIVAVIVVVLLQAAAGLPALAAANGAAEPS